MTRDVEGDDEVAGVVRLELQLLDPAVRGRAEQVVALLHPAFVEHGRSGRVWTREQIIETLGDDPGVSVAIADLVGVRLAGDVVLVTYRVTGDRASLRSSVWVRDPGGRWRVRFHQGTPGPSGD